ncbi:hypothetical protein [Bacillus paranthracis]|uniref:hypothetical protein n=1 Tax=Bacillus paranthracis TaxID=2026186 RepID=UPI000AFFA076|nr:hypothetical protein [Bacillus paranthracis]MCC2439130.1 hypothetical protein [Bacillus paranthracis]MDG1605456.1 hypothetical protein [Bacillus paranthracis]
MRFNKYTVMLMFLTIGSNAALSMWLKQGLLGVITTIVLLLIAAWTTKDLIQTVSINKLLYFSINKNNLTW